MNVYYLVIKMKYTKRYVALASPLLALAVSGELQRHLSEPQKAYVTDLNNDGISDIVIENRRGERIGFLNINGEYVRLDTHSQDYLSEFQKRIDAITGE